MKSFAPFILVIALTLTSNAQTPPGVTYRCFGQTCPPNTLMCQRLQYTLSNSTQLRTEVECLGTNATTLNSSITLQSNPFGAYSSFQSLTMANVSVVQNNMTVAPRRNS
ncbi:hypothetical protein TcasGA2_TC031871 [Tribolium castaneum]|uniref:Uncharacterized protein n=1 Tax=Tribolium castaneum TaxID=7070 RepID=A0A139W9K0_TRICA|nr:PREDICTED: uncharacterized protein LOC103313243 [Tribolium castaneum]KYB24611.1 hypothetical protein TcasGA2_TC031871 [Tribolium castaneum]|eukprot:XP_008194242.1 PREDICTED: uncharacterized protein LOC103313243 [Tribolium castaneum]